MPTIDIQSLFSRGRAWLRQRWLVALFMIAFAVLGTVYAYTTPLFEAPDETCHYLLVARLADGADVPQAEALCSGVLGQMAPQPPLYHLLGAALTFGIRVDPAGAVYLPNPFAAVDQADAVDNHNAVLHLEDQISPARGVPARLHLLRLLSVACSLATVAGVYVMVRRLWPARLDLAVGATALAAFNPGFVFMSASAGNRALAVALFTWALVEAIEIGSGRELGRYRPWALGLYAGLAALSRNVGLLAIIVVAASYLARAHWRWPALKWGELGRPLMQSLGVALLIGLPWYVINAIGRGSLLGLFGLAPTEPANGQSPLALLDSIVRSYWGLFGWGNVPADEMYYTFVRILIMLAGGGLLMMLARGYWQRTALRSHLDQAGMLAAMGLPLLAAMGVVALLVPGVRSNGQALYVLIGMLALVVYAGVAGWFTRHRLVVAGALAALFLGLAVAAPLRIIGPAYARPPILALEDIPADLHEVNVSFGEDLFLVGYRIRENSIRAGEPVHIQLYWAAQRKTTANYAVAINLVGYQGEPIGTAQSYPAGGNYPTLLWLPGQVIMDEYRVRVVPGAVTPTAATVVLSVRTAAGGEVAAARDPQGNAIAGQIELARVRVDPQRGVAYDPEVPLDVNIGDQMRLDGFDLDPVQPEPGQPWEVTLYWTGLQPMPMEYTVFVHLVDEEGEIVAQGDAPPMGGDYPTTLWPVGQAVRDPHRIEVPEEVSSGRYELRVGVYRLDTGERLPVVLSTPTPEGAAAATAAPVAGLNLAPETSTTLGAFDIVALVP